MPIAITDEHQELASTVRGVLTSHKALQAARALLEADEEGLPTYWNEMAELGWLGVHLPEQFGGSGAGLPELVVVLEELGRQVAPGPYLPDGAGVGDRRPVRLGRAEGAPLARAGRRLEDGRVRAGYGRASLVTGGTSTLRGDAGTVLGGGLADLILVRVGDDVVVVPSGAAGLTLAHPPNLDPTRRSVRAHADGVVVEPDDVIAGAAVRAVALARTLGAAEAVGGVHRVRGACRGLRQGAGPVRPDHRHLPGHQAPLRRHAGGGGAGHGRGVGGRPRRQRGHRRVLAGGGHGGHLGLRALRAQRPDEHSGARGHRLHLGARRASLPAPRAGAQRRAGHAEGRRGRHDLDRPGDDAGGDPRATPRSGADPRRGAGRGPTAGDAGAAPSSAGPSWTRA